MKLENKVKAVKPEKSYGHLNLNSKDFPFIKSAKITEEMEVVVTLKIESLRAPDRWDISEKRMGPNDVQVGARISSVAPVKSSK